MTDVIAHRGPDGSGVAVFPGDPPAGLGHRRLSILDPTPAGSQPMEYNGRYWVSYNGELYNFRELRHELELEGQRFRTECDTEVLLRMFAVHGPRMLERLNGIFAFAIWDDLERRLFLARDRLGVKPLYYLIRDGVFAFASEAKAILPYIGSPEIDLQALTEFLTFLWVPDPRTAFQGVWKLPAGHYAWYEGRQLSVRRYWDMQFALESRPERDWAEELRETTARCVRRQMVSDVPLGSFLSGGVDSSAVVAAMRTAGERISTYTIGFSGEDLLHEIVPDDLRHARRVGRLFATDYHEEILEPNALELLPKAVWHLDEPLADPAAISTYLICREAGKRMPVMLSGMGADEIFAGYPRHLAFKISQLLDALPAPLARAALLAVAPLGRPGRPGRLRGPRRNLWKFLRGAGLPPLERYLSFSSYYTPAELAAVLGPAADGVLGAHDPFEPHREYLARENGADSLNRLLYLDVKTFLPCLNLAYTDKMGMAASVEVRVPLLDDELVASASRIPGDLKLKNLRRKYIFKRSQEGIVPRDVIWRAKAGFGAPIRSWLAGDLAPLADELLADGPLRDRGFVDPVAVRRLRQDNASGREDNSLRLYALLVLELWSRTFIDRTWSFTETGAPRPRELVV